VRHGDSSRTVYPRAVADRGSTLAGGDTEGEGSSESASRRACRAVWMSVCTAPTLAPHVLVVPFPAQGYALSLLDFAGLLAARGLRLTVVTSPANLPLLSPLLAAHPGAGAELASS
jgi:hypothetical protein